MARATSLLHCPNEIQLAVVKQLPPLELAAVLKTSKQLQRLAEPLIYTAIKLNWRAKGPLTVMLLARTLLERPDLSSHVRTLRLDGARYIGNDDSHYPIDKLPATTTLSAEKVTEAIYSMGISLDASKTWIRETLTGTTDAVVATLISMLPKLESLHLSANWSRRSHFLGNIMRAALLSKQPQNTKTRLPSFDSLKYVSLAPAGHGNNHVNDENLADVLTMFYLPAIKDLSVSIGNPLRFRWPAPTPPELSSLTSLRLHRIREWHLGPILAAAKNLQKLEYVWFYAEDIDPDVSVNIVRLDIIAAAIAQLSETLTDLTIEAATLPTAQYGQFEQPSIAFHGSLDKLSQLRQLERLKLPWVFAMSMEVLALPGRFGSISPEGLEYLSLTAELKDNEDYEWTDDDFVSAIKLELESNAMSHLKSLKSISLPKSGRRKGYSSVCKEEMARLGAEYGLELTNQPRTRNHVLDAE